MSGKSDENREIKPSWNGLDRKVSFDDLARELASEGISRGRALKLVGTALLGAALVAFMPRVAEAAPSCPDKGPGCTSFCKGSKKRCVCIRTTEGENVCVVPECGDPELPCVSSSACGENQVCAKTARKCCDGEEPVCVRRCPIK